MARDASREIELAGGHAVRAAGLSRNEPAIPDHPLHVLQRSAGNRAVALLVQRKKGRFATVAHSPGATAVTNTFVSSHMGNRRDAERIARGRGLPVSHTIDIRELGVLLGEMRTRQQGGYYIPANQVNNPNGNLNQYLTGNEYNIWEIATDNKGRPKPTRLVRRPFYYDAPAGHGNACHHFDGLA